MTFCISKESEMFITDFQLDLESVLLSTPIVFIPHQERDSIKVNDDNQAPQLYFF